MTTLPAPTAAAVHSPTAASRGIVVVLVGRGEHPGVYERLGRRLAVDGYTVALPVTADGIEDVFAAHPEGVRVLAGSDTGALAAWQWALAHPVDALVLAGLPLDRGVESELDRDDELDLRTSCPVRRHRLAADPDFAWGRLGERPPAAPSALPAVPTLLFHGSACRSWRGPRSRRARTPLRPGGTSGRWWVVVFPRRRARARRRRAAAWLPSPPWPRWWW